MSWASSMCVPVFVMCNALPSILKMCNLIRRKGSRTARIHSVRSGAAQNRFQLQLPCCYILSPSIILLPSTLPHQQRQHSVKRVEKGQQFVFRVLSSGTGCSCAGLWLFYTFVRAGRVTNFGIWIYLSFSFKVHSSPLLPCTPKVDYERKVSAPS